MRADIIVKHEDWQRLPLREFLANHAMALGVPLPRGDVKGEVKPYVNQGRWVADCPTIGCAGAIVVSVQSPVFYCPDCGNQDNDGAWYQVVFPMELEAIERELLKRPARDGFRAMNRNWKPGETVALLAAENKTQGIK